MLIGLQRLCQIVVIGQRRTDDDSLCGKIGGRVEKVLFQRLTLPFHRRSEPRSQSLYHFFAIPVIGDFGMILFQIVEKDGSIWSHQRHPQVLPRMRFNVIGNVLPGVAVLSQFLSHVLVENLQLKLKRVHFVLLLTVLLKNNKRYRKDKENGHNAQVEFMTDTDFLHNIFLTT